jgi:hypothetical protein
MNYSYIHLVRFYIRLNRLCRRRVLTVNLLKFDCNISSSQRDLIARPSLVITLYVYIAFAIIYTPNDKLIILPFGLVFQSRSYVETRTGDSPFLPQILYAYVSLY